MNIEATKNLQQVNQTQATTQKGQEKDSDTSFAQELNELSEKDEKNIKDSTKTETENKDSKEENTGIEQKNYTENSDSDNNFSTENKGINNELENLADTIAKINRIDEKNNNPVKNNKFFDEKNTKREELGLIDNNINIQETKEKLTPEMNANMNFNSNGQPFSEFIKSESTKEILKTNLKDLEEEKAVLSTMEENIAIANKNIALKQEDSISEEKTKIVTNEQGIKKVDKETTITVDTVVKFDSVIMDKSDVEFFANLVDGNITNLSEVQNPEKSAAVSKTLADLLAKAMENNKPVRINFDNDISVIIKISRDGKLSADFLPSSQVAEAYLKENLPLLRQRFDENNIEYDELNQRQQQKQNDKNENRKKDGKNE